jgi:mannose-6-phosphate isomerase-like protein (cupin superfamily)
VTLLAIGAGLPRTGTRSLQLALESLLGKPCYHMTEVFRHLDHVPVWQQALDGDPPDWDSFLADYGAAVDWPPSAFWRELAHAYPNAPVILSTRETPEVWWRSADNTILPFIRAEPREGLEEWRTLVLGLLESRLAEAWNDPETAMAAYERHNAEVRAEVPEDRLVEWCPEDGWRPLCEALGVPIPDDPFPRVNTTAEWGRGRTREVADLLASPLTGKTIGTPDGSFVVAEWVDPGGPQVIAPLHVHYADDEAWYVLEGTLGFVLGEDEVEAAAGTAVHVPRGVRHSFSNPRPEPARYLLIMPPRIAKLVDELHHRSVEAPALFRKYHSELLA